MTCSFRRLVLATFAALQPAAANAADDPFAFFEAERQVMTASRRMEAAQDVPLAVDVITAEEIQASGVLNIWDLFRFRAGMDVLDTDTDGLAVVSIRGFPRSTVRQLQVLIDGRSVISSMRSSVNWQPLPVQLQDIERIEIIRGPNAALYGSNAGFGVINIITKKPTGSTGATASGIMGSRNLVRTQESVESATKAFQYRVSHTRMTRDASPSSSGAALRDFLFSNKGNFNGRWTPNADTTVELLAGGSWDTMGKNDTASAAQNRYRGHFQMLRLTRALGPGEAEVTAARLESVQEEEQDIGLISSREYQYSGEALYRVGWLDERLKSVAGVSYKLGVAESDQLFSGAPRQENKIARAFGSQRVEVTEWLSGTGGISLENSDTGGLEPAYQAGVVAQASKAHSFRFNFSVAPTIPSLFDTRANSTDSATKRRIGNPDLAPDRLYSYEAGYEGVFLRRLTVNADVFYIDHRDLNQNTFVNTVGAVTTNSFGNTNAAIARGAEAEIKFKAAPQRWIYANYTYERITDSAGDRDVTDSTPRHKFNFGGHAAVARGVSIGANVGYKDAYSFAPSGTRVTDINAYWRLDARLAYSPIPAVEVFIAGQNLTRPLHGNELDKGSLVPRSYHGGVSVKF